MPSRAHRTRRDPRGQWQLHWQVVEACQAAVDSAAEVLSVLLVGVWAAGGLRQQHVPSGSMAMAQGAEHQGWV